jgi:hypothetical protein
VDSVVDPLNQDPDPAFLDVEDNVVEPWNPDPAFLVNTDSDPDPGFDDQKFKEKIYLVQLKFCKIFC